MEMYYMCIFKKLQEASKLVRDLVELARFGMNFEFDFEDEDLE